MRMRSFQNKESEMKKPQDNLGESITITEIKMNEMRFNIVGTSPLMLHAVSAKAAGSLLFPAPKKNAAERATTMKHEPLEEFRDACYMFTDQDQQPTRLYMPGSAFHAAVASVAIDMAGARKAQIARLTNVPVAKVPIFGIPKLIMSIVRSSDMARTPDVRTLPILESWCCEIPVRFVASLLKEQSIANLFAASGVIIGVGDGRPEKGKLSCGQFRLCNPDDAQFLKIKSMGRAAQDAALEAAEPFDLETERLLNWFEHEKLQRAAGPAQSPKRKKKGDETSSSAATNGGEKGQDQRDMT
jgi:hypothetical protein